MRAQIRPAFKAGVVRLAAGFIACCAAVSSAHAQPKITSATEAQVRTAIVYNLAKFIEWPTQRFKNRNSQFEVCVASGDPMENAVQVLEGKPLHGRNINVNLVNLSADSLSFCHMIYVSSSKRSSLNLKTLNKLGVLTIGTGEAFLKSGGGIALDRKGQKMEFTINKTALNEAKITPSSKILKLAKGVR